MRFISTLAAMILSLKTLRSALYAGFISTLLAACAAPVDPVDPPAPMTGQPTPLAPPTPAENPLGGPMPAMFSMIPYLTADHRLVLLDPAQAVSEQNPAVVDQLSADAESHFSLRADVSGAVVSNIRLARLAYIKNGRVMVINLEAGVPHIANQVSNVTNAIAVELLPDYAEPSHSWLLLTDSQGKNSMVRSDVSASAAPITSAATGGFNVRPSHDSSGRINGFFTSEGQQLLRRDDTFNTPVVLMNVGSAFSFNLYGGEFGEPVFITTYPATSNARETLYRYNDNQTLSAVANNLSSFDVLVDNRNAFYVGNGGLFRLAHSAAVTAQVRMTDPAMDVQVDRMLPSDNRIVFEQQSSTGGDSAGIYSVLRDASAAAPTRLTPKGSLLFVESRGAVFIQNGELPQDATVARDDGSGFANASNAYWVTMDNFVLPVEVNLDTGAAVGGTMVRASYDGSTHAFDGLDAATGSPSTTNGGNGSFSLGSVTGVRSSGPGGTVAQEDYVQGFVGIQGYLPFFALTSRDGTASDLDAYVLKLNTSNSLMSVSALAGGDDAPLLR